MEPQKSKESNNITRREAIKHAGLVGVGSLLLPKSIQQNPLSFQQNDIIVKENNKPGSTDWQLTRVRPDASGHRTPWIEGYCSRQSVKAGESLDVMVSTDPIREFTLEVFRTGYYNGKGARLIEKFGPYQGKTQKIPQPGNKNIHECQWEPTLSLQTGSDWVSGVYLGRLSTIQKNTSDSYWQSYIVFILTDDRPADILFQCSDNTWQAYNRWPDNYSVYTHPKGGQGPWAQVSFDRPYGRQSQYMDIVNDPLSFGSGEYLSFEFPMAYFLEKHGYDVSYCSNSDMLTPDRGLKCKAFLSVGHDEYWDIRQYKSVEKMRDQGVSLLFFSGNSVCWVSPFFPNAEGVSNRQLFRGGPYGGDYQYARLREERHGPFPERGPDEGFLMGVRNVSPVNGGGDWIVKKADHWMFKDAGVKNGDSIPGLVGWEYHGDPPRIAGLEVVAGGTAWQGGDHPQEWCAVTYPGPQNNFVFNASTIFWSQGLSRPPGHTLPWSHHSRPHGPDPRVQKMTHNLLKQAIR